MPLQVSKEGWTRQSTELGPLANHFENLTKTDPHLTTEAKTNFSWIRNLKVKN